MRTTDLSGGLGYLVIEYPNENVFLKDNNYIRLSTNISASVELTALQAYNFDGISVVYSYSSPFKSLLFDLNNVLKSMYKDSPIELNIVTTCTYIIAGVRKQYNFNFTIKLIDGISFPDRTHSTRYIYIYNNDQLNNVELFFPTDGELTVGSDTLSIQKGLNTYDLSGYDFTIGKNVLGFTNQMAKPVLNIENFYPIEQSAFTVNMTYQSTDPFLTYTWLSDIYGGNKVYGGNYDIIVEMVENCGENDIMFRYLDADGCRRYVMGKVVNQNETTKSNDLVVVDDIYSNIAGYFTTDNTKDITVIFKDINHYAFIQDLFYSSTIEFQNTNGEWFNCKMKTTSLKTTDEIADDYEIQFTINN